MTVRIASPLSSTCRVKRQHQYVRDIAPAPLVVLRDGMLKPSQVKTDVALRQRHPRWGVISAPSSYQTMGMDGSGSVSLAKVLQDIQVCVDIICTSLRSTNAALAAELRSRKCIFLSASQVVRTLRLPAEARSLCTDQLSPGKSLMRMPCRSER